MFESFREILDAPGLWMVLGASTVTLGHYLLSGSSDGRVYDLGGLPTTTAWSFFSTRHDFMMTSLKRAAGLPFRFRIMHYTVTAVSGTEARKTFSNAPNLDFEDGYRMLVGGPKMADIDIKTEVLEKKSGVLKRFHLLFKEDRLANLIPTFLSDMDRRTSAWGQQGLINPFQEVNDLVFQMTVRMATCNELAGDPATIANLANSYWQMQNSATPTRLLLPWFPSESRKFNEQATMNLYLTFLKYVMTRRASGADTSDAVDVLIRNGDADNDVVELIMGIVFIGFINTGVTSCWALLYLAAHPEWRAKAVAELESLIENSSTASSTQAFHKKLSSITLEAWESQLTTLDLVIKETIRLTHNPAAPRRNIGKDLVVQGATIKTGDFMLYNFADTHLNPDIYSNPEEFDPGRYEAGREEDKKVPFGYLGWGAGRHPCAGMRIAKLKIKLVLAILLLQYEYETADEKGVPTESAPKQDRNDIHKARPSGKPVYLKFRRIHD